MIITIDGPAASGKSTISLALANRLSLYYVATGLLYRFIAYQLVFREKVNESMLLKVNKARVHELLFSSIFEYRYSPLQGAQIFYRGEDYSSFLKKANVDKWASIVGSLPQVREEIVAFQRKLATKHGLVVEGRDGGTVVFPQAEFKFFLTASEEVRARRWQHDQLRFNNIFTLEESVRQVHERDDRDKNREASPLKQAQDAILIDNSTMTLGATIDYIVDLVQKGSPQVEAAVEQINDTQVS